MEGFLADRQEPQGRLQAAMVPRSARVCNSGNSGKSGNSGRAGYAPHTRWRAVDLDRKEDNNDDTHERDQSAEVLNKGRAE